jgi:acyl-CoA synthetase (AMP-forming)/AMP-acid ligase II
MPTILQYEAEHNPERTFAIAAKSDNIEGGFHEVTFHQVTQAVNHVSLWLQARFESGNKSVHQTTLAYIGPPDLRYNILFYAAVQCRYKVRFPESLMIPNGER